MDQQIIDRLPEPLVGNPHCETLYEDSSVALSYFARGNYICLRWTGEQTLSTIQTGCNQLLLYMKSLGADKVLNDGRSSVGSWTTSIPWLVFHFLPLLKRIGLRKAAHVIAYDRDSKLSADSVQLFADVTYWDIEFFRSEEIAREWLVKD